MYSYLLYPVSWLTANAKTTTLYVFAFCKRTGQHGKDVSGQDNNTVQMNELGV